MFVLNKKISKKQRNGSGIGFGFFLVARKHTSEFLLFSYNTSPHTISSRSDQYLKAGEVGEAGSELMDSYIDINKLVPRVTNGGPMGPL